MKGKGPLIRGALALLLLSITVAPVAAHADVVELKSGQKIEGTFKGADDVAVKIEVGGQTVAFQPEQVRAIYYGAAPVSAEVQPSPVQEAMKAVRGLQSVSQGGITYRDYAPRVSDAKVIVDRYLQDTGEPESPGKASIKDALRSTCPRPRSGTRRFLAMVMNPSGPIR